MQVEVATLAVFLDATATQERMRLALYQEKTCKGEVD